MGKKGAKNIHHRKPQSLGGGNHRGNLSLVCMKQHSSWHNLFQDYTPEKIAEIINSVWLDSDFEFVVIERRTTCV